ncbi:hypothetical protein J4G02_12845 [Candidatus Poribacteria bacterium]|nr:hypothetical protein [Candidatus Poribacteria bacterium]
MRTIVIVWAVLFVIVGCSDDELHNSAPVIDRLIVPEKVNPGAVVELQVVAHDRDGDALTYVWGVDKGKLDSRTGQTVKWTVPSDLKMATVTVFANDGVNASVTKFRRVPIRLQNSAPVIRELVVSEQVHAVSSVELQAVIYDVDGDTLTYSWEVKKGVLDSETLSTPTWTAPIDTGVVTVALTVGDGVNGPVTKSVVVQIVHALIVPGAAAAGIKLGDGFDRVQAIYGRPSRRNSDFFAYWDPDIGLSGFFDGIGLVEGLSIRKPNEARTAGGVGIGSTLKRVEEEFGVAERVEEGGKVHWYWKTGIEFSYDADAKVKSISIFKRTGAAPAGFDETILRE